MTENPWPDLTMGTVLDAAGVRVDDILASWHTDAPGGLTGAGICCDPHPFNPECASPSITLRCMRMNRIRIGAIAISEAAIMTG